jgi:hypothetical protein
MPGRGEFGFKTLELACQHEPGSSGLNPPMHDATEFVRAIAWPLTTPIIFLILRAEQQRFTKNVAVEQSLVQPAAGKTK